MTEVATSSTCELSQTLEKKCDDEVIEETPCKKRKLENSKEDENNRLETRLGGILCCAVCLDLPKAAVYQCSNGHLMCAGCFTHLLADARIRDETATCPNCRVEISRSLATRNLAVEKAVSELPAECQFCCQKYARNSLDRHRTELCDERLIRCEYHILGCGWKGPFHELTSHEQQCTQPSHTGAQVLPHLRRQLEANDEAKTIHKKINDVLSMEKITFNDLQLKPYRTDEFIHKLFYETSRFTALTHQWVIKARLNDNKKDSHLTNERNLSYQLVLKSKISSPICVQYCVLKGPFGDACLDPHMCYAEFTEPNKDNQYFSLPLKDSNECNKLLAARTIDFRLMLALVNKNN